MIRHSRSWIIGLACSFGAVPSTALAVIRYVNASRPDDSGNGLSWATAEKNLQSALVVAASGDEIWVAAGTYKPDQGGGQVAGNRNATFSLQAGVSIYGGFMGGETLLSERNANLNVCILSGDLNGDDVGLTNNAENSRTVVSTGLGVGISPVLDGLTIMGGNEDGLGRGAGIKIGPSTGPTIVNCTIQWNSANIQGGGVYFANTLGVTTFRGCQFLNNSSSDGGAVFGTSAELHLSRCIFSNNSANNGGAVYAHGASGLLSAVNCFFSANSCSLSGGALYVGSPATANVTNCEFSGNLSDDESGAIEVNNATLNMANCTVVNNSADQFYGGLFGIMSTLNVSNSIFWGNTDTDGDPSTSQVFGALGSSTVSYSIIQDGWAGLGSNNLSSDPMFFDAGGNDFRVFASSPAVDSGDNAAVPADVTDLDGDADTLEPTPLALGQIARFEDNPNVSDANGSGTAPIVDRGAYEVRAFNILYVDADGPGPGDWVNAYTKLQDALTESKASASSQIWVAEGMYFPDEGAGLTLGDRTATFQLLNGVELYGGFAGNETSLSERDIEANPTILSGDLSGNDIAVACTQDTPDCDALGGLCFEGSCIIKNNNSENSYHVVTGSGTDATAVVDGFTIREGFAGPGALVANGGGMLNFNNGSPTVTNCTFMGNVTTGGGGAMYNFLNSNPAVTNCRFIANSAASAGGGMGNANNSSPTIRFGTFTANAASTTGGGMDSDSGSVLIASSNFTQNKASIGGGISSIGSPNVSECLFAGNRAAQGGGMYNGTSSSSTVHNCAFKGNLATLSGGGMFNANVTSASVTNCLFSGNAATDGGGMENGTSSPNVVNCTFSLNTASNSGGGIHNASSSSPNVSNSILWSNTDTGGMDSSAQIHTDSGTPTVNYSIVQGGWTGAGANNLMSNPLYVDADGTDNIPGTADDNPRLSGGSPAIDSGNSNLIPSDVTDVDDDADFAESVPLDLDGNARTIDDILVADIGVPGMFVDVVDRGAFEHASTVIFVDASATGADDGTTWTNAFVHLQKALSVAAGSGGQVEEIWVADGDYKPDLGPGIAPGDREATFQLLNGVALYGGFEGGETLLSQRAPSLYVATLSGDLAGDDAPVACTQDSPDCDAFGDLCVNGTCIIAANNAENSLHVVTGSGTDSTAVMDGLTITAGNANDFSHGAGMINISGSPTVSNCVFQGNSTQNRGGGMMNSLGSPTVIGCTFRGNWANSGGGGMRNESSGAILVNCTFSENASADNGGGINNFDSSITVTHCDFLGNTAGFQGGGGIYNQQSSPTVSNCRFTRNRAQFFGGGIRNNLQSDPFLLNCTFIGNTTDLGGGMANHSDCDPTVLNCTFAANSANNSGGGVYNGGGSPALTNCILWANSDLGGMDESAQVHISGGVPTVNYSIVQGGWSGAGSNNLNGDPLFFDADGPDNVVGNEDDDLRLQPGSPAIDAANTPALPLDTDDADGDGNTTERYPFDLAGNPRILDDPATTDTGVPGSPVVDMGAYEYFADCNGNSVPDECDISCGAAMGPCDIPGCGGSQDCGWAEGFPNGVPDECDLGCGAPDCDDCNLNGVPDACDIANATSLDENADFVPDECSQFDGVCMGNDWSCFDNWNIPGEVYPDNTGPTTYSVTLDETDDVFLDVDVTIDTLRITDDAVLNVTQTGPTGDLTIIQPGGLLIDGGTLYIDNDRSIDVTAGTFSVRNEGLYAKAPMARSTQMMSSSGISEKRTTPALPEASLQTASSVSSAAFPEPIVRGFTEGDVGAGTVYVDSGGAVVLTGSMVMTVEGDFELNGEESCTCCTCNPGECPEFRGVILPPPKFRAADISQTDVLGSMDMFGSVDFYYGSANNLDLNGDFNNASTNPGCFNWSVGGLTLGGSAMQTLEAAGRDLGATLDGFYYGPDTNFALGELEISAGRSVTLVNNRANTVGTGSCQEALYVHHLILRSNATLTLSNARIYYEALTQESGATLVNLGCGQSLEVNSCTEAASCGDGDACTIDDCNAGSCSNTPISFLAYGDTVYTGKDSTVDVDDILCVLDAFSGIFAQCPFERADLVPCASDIPTCVDDKDCSGLGVPCQEGRCRVLDVDDILAVLDAFAGIYLCSDTCP